MFIPLGSAVDWCRPETGLTRPSAVTVLICGSRPEGSRGRGVRDPYQFADYVAEPNPFAVDRDRNDSACVCLRYSDERATSLIISLSAMATCPIFLVVRPRLATAVVLAAELIELRTEVDRAWRQSARKEVARLCAELAPSRLRFELVLGEDGIAPSATRFSAALPAFAKRQRRTSIRTDRAVNVQMKEVIDWTFYLRVASGRSIGVTLAQRVIELGGAVRTFRRVCRRLHHWIPHPPNLVTPLMVIDALLRRLTPPPGGAMNSGGAQNRRRCSAHAYRLLPTLAFRAQLFVPSALTLLNCAT